MRHRNFVVVTLSVALCGLNLCATARATPSEEADSKAADVERVVRSEMAARGIPGAQVAIVQNRKIVYSGAYGQAKLDSSTAVTQQTVFPINSISKAMAGVAVMQLVEAGRLNLDAPLKSYLESLPDAWKTVTVRHVLTHMSGLPEIVDDNVRTIGGLGPEEAWKTVQELPLDSQPGVRFDYTQTNYVAIAKLIEKLTNTSYADFVREGQFAVVGLKRSGFASEVESDTASLYTYLTLKIQGMKTVGVERSKVPLLRLEPMATYMNSAGGVKTTATELATWAIALQNLSLVSKSSLDQLWKPQAQLDGAYRGLNALVNGYGLGWPSVVRAAHPAVAPIGGARAALFIYPNDDLAVVVLTNLMGASPEKFIDRIASIYIPGITSVGR